MLALSGMAFLLWQKSSPWHPVGFLRPHGMKVQFDALDLLEGFISGGCCPPWSMIPLRLMTVSRTTRLTLQELLRRVSMCEALLWDFVLSSRSNPLHWLSQGGRSQLCGSARQQRCPGSGCLVSSLGLLSQRCCCTCIFFQVCLLPGTATRTGCCPLSLPGASRAEAMYPAARHDRPSRSQPVAPPTRVVRERKKEPQAQVDLLILSGAPFIQGRTEQLFVCKLHTTLKSPKSFAIGILHSLTSA